MVHTGTFIFSDIWAVAEVARRYARLTFIAGFGGYADMWSELPVVFETAPNLLLDTSLLWGDAVQEIVTLHGAERVLYGSAEPLNRYAVGLKSLARLGLSDAETRAVLHGNARRVFRLP
jgi:predicted TIM-barrel fold metal-dependent hydrolase